MESGLQDGLLKKSPGLDSVGFAFGMRDITTAVPFSEPDVRLIALPLVPRLLMVIRAGRLDAEYQRTYCVIKLLLAE